MRRKGRGGKDREAPTHLIEHSKFTHAGRVTKNKSTHGQTYPHLARMLAISSTNIWQRSLWLTVVPSGTSPSSQERPSKLLGHLHHRLNIRRVLIWSKRGKRYPYFDTSPTELKRVCSPNAHSFS